MKIGIIYPVPDPLAAANWSGTPHGLASGFTAIGADVVPLGAKVPRGLHQAVALLSRATGRTGVLLAVQVCALTALLPGLVAGINLGGIVGAAAAHVIVIVAVTSPVYLNALRRSTGLRIPALLSALFKPSLTAALTALAAWAATLGLANPLLKLLVAGIIGLCLYAYLNRQDISRLVPAGLLPRFMKAQSPFQARTHGHKRSAQ